MYLPQTKKKAVLQAKEMKKTGGGTSDAPSLTLSETCILGVIQRVHYEGKLKQLVMLHFNLR